MPDECRASADGGHAATALLPLLPRCVADSAVLDQARLRCAPPRRRGPRIALPSEARSRGRASDKGSSAQINQAPLAPRRAARGLLPRRAIVQLAPAASMALPAGRVARDRAAPDHGPGSHSQGIGSYRGKGLSQPSHQRGRTTLDVARSRRIPRSAAPIVAGHWQGIMRHVQVRRVSGSRRSPVPRVPARRFPGPPP
jgi:hypothetical protein